MGLNWKMATGRMKRFNLSRWLWGLAVILTIFSQTAWAQKVSLVGIFGSGKAVLVIDGGPPRTLVPGQSLNGVRLLKISRNTVTVDISGKIQEVSLGDHGGMSTTGSGKHSVTLIADSLGHFRGEGAINGHSVSFLVDTGASAVTMDSSTAEQLGLDLHGAVQGMVGTANGVVQSLRISLESVRLGDVTLYNVDGFIVQSNMPGVLLGASFLNRMEMHRDGNTMVLTQRY